MDESDLTERLVDAAEFAGMLGVSEEDVLEWMLDGDIPYVDGPEGKPQVRVAESYEVDGPMSSWERNYSVSAEPAFQSELARRRREHELASLEWGEVDVDALADAFASRLKAVVPSVVQVTVEGAMILLLDANGRGAGIDIASHASLPKLGSGADRVLGASVLALRNAQDELAMVTTDPWPQHGSGRQPDPHAEINSEGETVRLFYGDPASPILELEPLRLVDVLDTSSP
jgi:hypothetical protein